MLTLAIRVKLVPTALILGTVAVAGYIYLKTKYEINVVKK